MFLFCTCLIQLVHLFDFQQNTVFWVEILQNCYSWISISLTSTPSESAVCRYSAEKMNKNNHNKASRKFSEKQFLFSLFIHLFISFRILRSNTGLSILERLNTFIVQFCKFRRELNDHFVVIRYLNAKLDKFYDIVLETKKQNPKPINEWSLSLSVFLFGMQ